MSTQEPESFYSLLGGSDKIGLIVNRFYELMDTLPEAKLVRDLHDSDLSSANEKLRLFLIGWTGGPQLYIEKFGHPRLRARHLPFRIGTAERDEWILCMFRAFDELSGLAPVELKSLKSAIFRLADHMRNQPIEPVNE